jgi:hypothetical protein
MAAFLNYCRRGVNVAERHVAGSLLRTLNEEVAHSSRLAAHGGDSLM